MPDVITANDLHTGAVVYLGPDGAWVEQLTCAAVAHDADCLHDLEAHARRAVARNAVTAVYAMPVSCADGAIEPLSVRERIRAARGPSI
jgi:Protein of unknown function (DUF2849)